VTLLPSYLRAAAPLLPGASRLPGLPGRGAQIPADLQRSLTGVGADPERVARYARACGFSLRGTLPATFPHVLAFPLHMRLMTDGRFPLGPIGLVHLENSITQVRPLGMGETLDLVVRPTPLEPHAKGRVFALVTEARVADELVWSERSTFLSRGQGGSKQASGRRPAPPGPTAEWRLPGDLGRRYAGVSGDSNPIHLHPLTARLFGFPRAIAHGMWTKARCLAALERTLPDAYTVEVAFRMPILIPGTVAFGSEGGRFSVQDARTGAPHLDGRIA
jgi:acyl dehydratase